MLTQEQIDEICEMLGWAFEFSLGLYRRMRMELLVYMWIRPHLKKERKISYF